jgi:hypothetical protein
MMNRLFENKMKILSLILLLTMAITPLMSIYAQYDSKQNTGYLLQEIVIIGRKTYDLSFKHGYTLPFPEAFHMVDEATLLDFFEKDTVDYNRVTMLCDPGGMSMFSDSAITRQSIRFSRIEDILFLDDSEIYIIGEKKYVIRKIKYAYFDNSQVKVYLKGGSYYMWDDITDEDEKILKATYDVSELYNIDYYQCYYHLIEILPTPPQIQKYLWKRLYQSAFELNEEGLMFERMILMKYFSLKAKYYDDLIRNFHKYK